MLSGFEAVGAEISELDREASLDHAGIIRAWGSESYRRGEALYNSICITCHGNLTQAGSLPTSRPFWGEPFKNGNDPLSIFRTLTTGFGQMPSWTALTPEQRYDTIHFLREHFVKEHNPGAYFKVTETYLEALPKGVGKGTKTEEMLEFEKGPKYLKMDFGPVLFWTYQVDKNNIAQKGIAIRLDQGPGGISKGRAWMMYDHDTMRVASGWSGEGFINWRGIAFDGSHGTHTSTVGSNAFVNPPGPGWSNPLNDSWEDPRPTSRDHRPYGPLPRSWVRYKGIYLHDQGTVLAYDVGSTPILESPSVVQRSDKGYVFVRTFEVGAGAEKLQVRIAPESVMTVLGKKSGVQPSIVRGHHVITIPPRSEKIRFSVFISDGQSEASKAELVRISESSDSTFEFSTLMNGGQRRWQPSLTTRGVKSSLSGSFEIDTLMAPSGNLNPWTTWNRFGGFDFFRDGKRAAVASWNGDVWIVDGVDSDLSLLTWTRIASGLFQPLGVRIVGDTIFVTCRDMIARLHDLNGDGEIDFIENFNNDHQVTEHFHEFAMGLQTDAEGNFYYAKSARHALPALVPHHGTLLKVSKDGLKTEIVANGFRAANGVCINPDGTFFVTDQEGHWTPKNRINWVKKGGFYGNLFGYHEGKPSSDEAMEPPLVWITNEMDRSPGELIWITDSRWGSLNNKLLSLSYGTGRIFVVPHEKQGETIQGGVMALPIPDFPTGVMRGRMHPNNGYLYLCGLFAWAGNCTGDGGFYRMRPTGKPMMVQVGYKVTKSTLSAQFSDPLDATHAKNGQNYKVKVWGLSRSANYGSKHVDERPLEVSAAEVESDGRTLRLSIPDLETTRGMEVRFRLKGADGTEVERVLHSTINHIEGRD